MDTGMIVLVSVKSLGQIRLLHSYFSSRNPNPNANPKPLKRNLKLGIHHFSHYFSSPGQSGVAFE
jgi:hypothetical protein